MTKLRIPNTNRCLEPHDKVKLGRFEDQLWEVGYGWFSFGGNRPICGWYLKARIDGEYVEKPLQLADLDDMYLVHRDNRLSN